MVIQPYFSSFFFLILLSKFHANVVEKSLLLRGDRVGEGRKGQESLCWVLGPRPPLPSPYPGSGEEAAPEGKPAAAEFLIPAILNVAASRN